MIEVNRSGVRGEPLSSHYASMLGLEGAAKVSAYLAHCPGSAPTPTISLPDLARTLGIARLDVKDEGGRLGLGSFKALGGAYAVIQLVLERAGRQLDENLGPEAVGRHDVRAIAANMTVVCATDGNHGRSVAAGAKMVGCKAVIYLHSGVSEERAAAIARYGAETVRVPGNYDDSVATTWDIAQQRGWTIVSDTSWPGYHEIPLTVMQGYTCMVAEVLDDLDKAPTHVFVQAGVGGLAAAVAAHLHLRLAQSSQPRIIVVEPDRAACLLASLKAGRPVKVAHEQSTVMAMLECFEPSLVAWDILSRTAHAFMTVGEDDAIEAMRRLAFPLGLDPAIVAGESGGVGLAGLLRACSTDRELLKLDEDARVLIFNTEGATDPNLYRKLVGREPQKSTEVIAL